MNLNQETTAETTEIPNELPQNPEFANKVSNFEQAISSVADETPAVVALPVETLTNMPSIFGLDVGQSVFESRELSETVLNGSEPVLTEVDGVLNPPTPVLNSLIPVLNDKEQVLNAIEPVLKSESDNLNTLGTDLNGSEQILNGSDTVLSPPAKLQDLAIEKDTIIPLKPELVNIFQYVKAQLIRGDKVVLKPVGIDEALFNELMIITKQGGIPISRYCSEVLRHHEDVLGLQLMKNELAEVRQLYNEAVNENLRLTMDKKTVEDSEKLLVNISQSHLDSKESLQVALDEKQAELNRANATIISLKKAVENVSESVQESYKDYFVNILPETLSLSLKDTYDEIISIVKSHKLPKDFDTVEMFFNEHYQRNMELITKQQEIIKLAKSKNNE